MTHSTESDRSDIARSSSGPGAPERLLAAERDELLPLLRGLPEDAFSLRTCCPGWTVRHVVAHCAAALRRAVEGRMGDGAFTPEGNDRDIAEQAHLSLPALLDGLERWMTEAGPAITAVGGRLDILAFGEWVHAGDIREAIGEPGAYGGAQLDLALDVLAPVTAARGTLRLDAHLDHGRTASLGAGKDAPAVYRGDGPTLVRLCTGRPLTGTRYELEGAREAEVIVIA